MSAPIPMRLSCPECGTLHVDAGEFATKEHHTHACQACGHVWRPALVPTVGVRFLPGYMDDGQREEVRYRNHTWLTLGRFLRIDLTILFWRVKVRTMSEGTYTIGDGKITRETDKAVLFDGPDHSGWVPKSVIHDDSEVWKVGQEGSLVVHYWWADKMGFLE